VCVVAILTTRVAELRVTAHLIGVYLCLAIHTDVVAVLVGIPNIYEWFYRAGEVIVGHWVCFTQ
jgi:hypothetical protein